MLKAGQPLEGLYALVHQGQAHKIAFLRHQGQHVQVARRHGLVGHGPDAAPTAVTFRRRNTVLEMDCAAIALSFI